MGETAVQGGATLKFKMADPKEVTDLMVAAVRDSEWFAGGPHVQFVPNLVRDINLALTNAGCVIMQLGNDRPHACNTPYGPTCWCEQ